MIGARDAGAALDAVIADSPGWEGLGDLVATATALAATVASDPLNHVLAGYSRFRRYTPRMLRTLDIEASPVAKPLLEAVDVLRNAATARPTGFLRPNSKWSRLLRTQPDHRLWETAVLFHLRDAFRAGDLWLARSRRYGDIRKTLLSAPAVVDADRSLPVPASPQDWLAERKGALDEGLRRLDAANRELGRALKTEFVLQYMSEPKLRAKVRRGLLKVEQLHALARAVYYGQRGRIAAREVYDQMNACSCLTLILACIVYWQAREISRLAAAPDFPFDPDLLRHVSPIEWKNVVLYGEIKIDPAKLTRRGP